MSHTRDGKDEGANFPSQTKSRSHSPMDADVMDHANSSSQKRDGKDSAGKGRRSRSRDRGR